MGGKELNRRPSERIRTLSAQAALGDWELSTRVNTRREGTAFINGVPMLVLGAAGAVGVPWLSEVAWWGRLILVLFCLVLLLIGLVITWAALDYHRIGQLLLHRYAHGFVVERTRRGAVAARYDDVHAELLTYREPGDSSSSPIDHVMLRITFSDGHRLAMAESEHDAPEALTEIADRCHTGESRRIDYRAAVEMLTERSWL